MQPFTTLTAQPAPLPIMNVDTDMIIPKQFLKTIKRTGLGSALFYEMRYDMEGKLIPDFVLNKPEFKNAELLVSGENFGCGSSREHAPWALLDYGIRSIIAPSFADIFYNNCFKNGILPIVLKSDDVAKLMEYASKPGAKISVELEAQKVSAEGVGEFIFTIDQFRKYCLLNGLDDIGLTLAKGDLINSFEQKQKAVQPWLYN